MAENRNEVLLKVENLCQYFGPTKAVDNVSFDVRKGEVFGLVGESGCGKTTTGRSIIKLYDITSGSIYYKGKRIAAGTKSYKDEIAAKKEEIKALKKAGAPAEKIEACKARIEELKKDYDYIFLDCPPIDLVADASIITEKADMSIFVIRSGKLGKEALSSIEELYKSGKYRHMALLLNSVELKHKKYGYGKSGYGYGYGYGYGN